MSGALSGAARASGTGWRADPLLRWRLGTYAVLLMAAAAAWAVTARPDVLGSGMGGAGVEGLAGTMTGDGMDAADGMAGMAGSAATGLTAVAVVAFVGVWVVMMAAMMFPSVAPVVATYVTAQQGRRRRGMPAARGGAAFFVAGYLVSWSAVGLVVASLPLLAPVVDGALEGDRLRLLVAAVLAGAAVYELTPWKQACLRRCRGPVAFVVHSWRNGTLGALRMGLEHGTWCVGCCWALMAALVGLGLMDLRWMALVSLLIALEKLLPWRRLAVGSVTATLAGLSALVVTAPGLLG